MQRVITARDFMRRELVTLRPDSQVLDGVACLLKDSISGAPVVDEGNRYLGVFSEKCCIKALTEIVRAAERTGQKVPAVNEFMNRDVITIDPDCNVFEAIDDLLKKRISGAPVVDKQGRYVGVFSEKTAMQVIVAAVYDQVPGTIVSRYTNLDRNRLIDRDASLLEAACVFQRTPYRRLPVLDGDRLVGQVSRRDVLRSEYNIARQLDVSVLARCDTPGEAGEFRSGQVGQHMDALALVKGPGADMLEIAEAFLNSPYRRLPIVENGTLIGQVSRRDLLSVAAETLRPPRAPAGPQTLYLSSVADTVPPSLK